LQIVQINDKDLKDAMLLLLAGEVGEKDEGMVNARYIARLMAEDWGFYYTSTTNLHRIKGAMTGVPVLSQADGERICSKADLILKHIEDVPKSGKWRGRAKIGTKKPWYNEVTDWG
jgi:hypothetical protein